MKNAHDIIDFFKKKKYTRGLQAIVVKYITEEVKKVSFKNKNQDSEIIKNICEEIVLFMLEKEVTFIVP